MPTVSPDSLYKLIVAVLIFHIKFIDLKAEISNLVIVAKLANIIKSTL